MKQRNRQSEIEPSQQIVENHHRIFQLIKSHDLYDKEAKEIYHFVENNRYIRSILVTPFQQDMLARGKIAIVRFGFENRDFALVPANIARTIWSMDSSRLILLHSVVEDWKDLADIVDKEFRENHSDVSA